MKIIIEFIILIPIWSKTSGAKFSFVFIPLNKLLGAFFNSSKNLAASTACTLTKVRTTKIKSISIIFLFNSFIALPLASLGFYHQELHQTHIHCKLILQTIQGQDFQKNICRLSWKLSQPQPISQ